MALDTTLLQYTTREKFLPVLKNNIYNKTRLLRILMGAGRVQDWTGRSLLWDVVAKKHQSVGLFSGYSTVANQPVNPLAQASLSNANYYATVAISKEEMKLNAGRTERLIDILKAQMQNAESTLKDLVATDIYGSAATRGGMNIINGLALAITDTTGTYAGINRATTGNDYWHANADTTGHTLANLKDPTSTSYLPQIMYTMYTNCSHDESPNLIVTTETVYNLYQLIAQVQNLTFNNEIANLGFGGVQFGPGVTMIFDKYCTASYMYFLNTNDFTFFVVPGANFDFDEDEGGSIWKQPTDQLAKLAHLIFMGQLRLDAPWQQGVLSSVGAS
jgi:hypothetical protein